MPYLPESLLAIALFEILNGESSPAAWYRDASTRQQCQFLGLGIAPSRTTWYDFRDRAGKFIEKIHRRIIEVAIDEQLVDPTQGCLDGTFTAASTSRHKIFNLSQINKRRSVLKRVVAKLDDTSQPCTSRPLGKIPKWIGQTRKGRQRQLEHLRLAKAKILEEIRLNRNRHVRYRRDEEKILVSPADVEAVIGKDKLNVIRPLYNTQNMCSINCDMILAYCVEAKCNDQGSLLSMIHKTRSITRGKLSVVHADCGYCSVTDLQDCKHIGINLYAPVQENNGMVARKAADGTNQIPSKEFRFEETTKVLTCPAGYAMIFRSEAQQPRADGRFVKELRYEQSVSHCQSCSMAGKCLQPEVSRRTITRLKDQHILDAQQAKMATESGKKSARLRSQQVERRFADGKIHRNQGTQNGRGLARVKAEVGLLVVAQNILTLYNLRNRRKIQVT